MWHVKTSRLMGLAIWTIIFIAFAFLGYPFAIAKTLGRNAPSGWTADLGKLTFSAIHKEIGPPHHDMSGKEYQAWAEDHWWGVKMLKIASNSCCAPQAHPSHIQYLVYVIGRDKPVVNEFIFDDLE